jgi:hypothetical protein
LTIAGLYGLFRPRAASAPREDLPARLRAASVTNATLGYRRPASNPAFDTKNGTRKFSAQRTHVAVVAFPAAITVDWLMAVSTTPTTSAMRIVRRRL